MLATVPWFPGKELARRVRGLPRAPRREHIGELLVRHPRTLYVPRLAPGLAAPLYAASLAPELFRYRGRVDVVLGSWAYPDGCAAIGLAAAMGVPAVVKLHGSDLNVVARLPGPRRILRAALPRACRVVAVSRALADLAVELGVARERIELVYNGVDSALFHVADRRAARLELSIALARPLILYVGNLKENKGVLDLVRAFALVAERNPDIDLVIVGSGPARAAAEALAAPLGERVRLIGARPLAEIGRWMAACDVLTLPSWNEGTPNVLLEALACGRRVVASPVGGVPDVIATPALGEMPPPRDPPKLAEALLRVATTPYDPGAIAAVGSRGDWATSAAHLYRVLQAATAPR